MANSVSPTVGGIMAAIGGILGLGVNAGHRRRPSAAPPCTLLAAGVCYVIAGLVAATMRRDLLGPAREPDRPRRAA